MDNWISIIRSLHSRCHCAYAQIIIILFCRATLDRFYLSVLSSINIALMVFPVKATPIYCRLQIVISIRQNAVDFESCTVFNSDVLSTHLLRFVGGISLRAYN